MSEYRSIKIVRGSAGFGGPLIITPTEEKHTVMYITGGGTEPECLKKICELSGMDAVDGFHGSAPENTIAMVIIDCGGTLRCGIYPKKGIPTVNIMPTGKSGPMAQYIKEDIYVSAVTSKQVSLASDSEAASSSGPAPDTSESDGSSNSSDEKVKLPQIRRSRRPSQRRKTNPGSRVSDSVSEKLSTHFIRPRATPYRPASQHCFRSWDLYLS